MRYFNTKKEVKVHALWQQKATLQYYAEVTAYSQASTKIYEGYFPGTKTSEKVSIRPEITVVDSDTVSALFDASIYNAENKVNGPRYQVLNFASYTNPGGGFENGSLAQEEMLCHESNLYLVLKAHLHDFYVWNKEHLNGSLYENRGLYSPCVRFFASDEDMEEGRYLSADVITVAAPIVSIRQRYVKPAFTQKENEEALKERIGFVLDIANKNAVVMHRGNPKTTLILGAFGCGAFGQDPKVVASIFKKYLDEESYNFLRVIFAIPDGKNLEAFREVFDE